MPGLILEAYDVSQRIVYTFKQYHTVSGKEIGLPEDAISSTEKEYTDMQAAFRANPQAFFNASTPSAPASGSLDGTKIKITSVVVNGAPSGTKGVKKVNNFPIELTKD